MLRLQTSNLLICLKTCSSSHQIASYLKFSLICLTASPFSILLAAGFSYTTRIKAIVIFPPQSPLWSRAAPVGSVVPKAASSRLLIVLSPPVGPSLSRNKGPKAQHTKLHVSDAAAGIAPMLSSILQALRLGA